ncbi:MAG TPA: helix-turn-helix transcriptional regulator [Chloroflexia bacterium]|nr:helix-turn-helix transcriptional regulator [Chloroflexia bacterium]
MVNRKSTGKRHSHPIDRRLKEMGKSRRWLAKRVGRTPQTIGLYCNYQISINPNSLVTKRICRVLEVDLNYLILGKGCAQAQEAR